jgi:hypothetical protein
VRNPVLRGDLRARTRSRKVLLMEMFLLSVLGLLTFLGLPPELNRIDPSADPSRVAGLGTALLAVQAVLVTYFASACALQEIAVEGEKAPVDLVCAPFAPRVVVTGKSLSSFLTILYWLVLGAPLILLAWAIRQEPIVRLAAAGLLTLVVAWGIAQVGMLLGVLIEPELSRTAVHWGVLLVIFVGTLALPQLGQWANPIVAIGRAATGTMVPWAAAAYAAMGCAADCCAGRALQRFVTA